MHLNAAGLGSWFQIPSWLNAQGKCIMDYTETQGGFADGVRFSFGAGYGHVPRLCIASGKSAPRMHLNAASRPLSCLSASDLAEAAG